MRPEEEQRKKRFCEKRKCILIFLFLLIVLVALTCIVTFAVESAREKQQYNTDDLKWWQKTIIYQVYPRSFQDSNGDGTGDLKGIIQRLDHFTYLGVGAIWLSPFYDSPMKDFGYDIRNYTKVAPEFGDLNDFENLIKEAKKRGIKVIIDFVPNHSSNEHQWFESSRRSVGKYANYYIWRDCQRITHPNGSIETIPPNNWLSVFGGSAWIWDPIRNKCYYHAFLDSQPDFNFRSKDVQDELKNVLKFWLDKGVSGFRADAIKFMFEANDTSQDEVGLTSTYEWLETDNHNLTTNFPEIYPVLNSWHNILQTYEDKDKEPRYLVTESYGISNAIRNQYYAAGTVPFNFDLISNVNKTCGGTCLQNVIDNSLADLGDYWPNFVLGNHDNPRIASRFGDDMVNVVNMLLLTLPGTPTVYYGEEIGMEDTKYTFNETKDPRGLHFPDAYEQYSRDPERSPMQWDSSVNAGFSSGIPWLHTNPDYKNLNVQDQKEAKGTTTIKIFKKLAEIRRLPSFNNNNKLTYPVVSDDVISYVRTAKGRAKYLVALNFGYQTVTFDFSKGLITSGSGRVEASTENFANDDYKVGKSINLHKIKLGRGQGLVIKAN